MATREGGSAPGARRVQTEDPEAEGRETPSSCSAEVLRPSSPPPRNNTHSVLGY